MDNKVKNTIKLLLELSHLLAVNLSVVKSEDGINSWLLAMHYFLLKKKKVHFALN